MDGFPLRVVRRWFASLQQVLRQPRHREEDASDVLLDAIAGALPEDLPLCWLENTLDSKASIAVRHRRCEEYRGYLLYSDSAGRTVLMERKRARYVESTPRGLLLIESLEAGRLVVDALLNARVPSSERGEEPT